MLTVVSGTLGPRHTKQREKAKLMDKSYDLTTIHNHSVTITIHNPS